MKSFNIIVAIDTEKGIGKEGFMPWNLPGDLKHFKDITCSVRNPSKKNVVIMGRKTWDSIPEKFRPLKGRVNVVLTRNKALKFPDDVLIASSFEEGFEILESALVDKFEEIFVIGGEDIFKQAIMSDKCKKLFVTHILEKFDCNTFFPQFEDRYCQVSKSAINEENSIKYYFSEYILRS